MEGNVMNTQVAHALRTARSHAHVAKSQMSSFALDRVIESIAEALYLAEAEAVGPLCEAPSCGNVLKYSGTGRHPRFCGDRCKQRSYRAARAAERAS